MAIMADRAIEPEVPEFDVDLGGPGQSLAELAVEDTGVLLIERVEAGRVVLREPHLGSIATFDLSSGSERTSFNFRKNNGSMHLGVKLGEILIPGYDESQSTPNTYQRPPALPVGRLVTRFFKLSE